MKNHPTVGIVRKGVIAAAWLCGLALTGRAQTPAGAPMADGQMALLRGQVQQFQATLNREIQNAVAHPFAMLQDAKGIYLPRFGVVFHMELNLAPLRTISAFDVRPYTEEELRQARDTKLLRIAELKTLLSRLLQQHGSELSALPPEQNVAVVVHLFNLPSERTEGLPSQIIVEASRGVLADAALRRVPAEEFRKKVEFFDF